MGLKERLLKRPDQYQFDWQGLAIAMVRHAGLHEGRWQVTFSFTQSATNVQVAGGNGATSPAVFNVIQYIGLIKVTDKRPDSPLIVDAGEVNPKPVDSEIAATQPQGVH